MSENNNKKHWQDLPDRAASFGIEIKWQHGPIKEAGLNGTQVDDVLGVCLERLQVLNEIMPCRENSLAITKLQEAQMWLRERTRDRVLREVEGTNEP